MRVRTLVLGSLLAAGSIVLACRDRNAHDAVNVPPPVDSHALIEGCPPTNVGVSPRPPSPRSARDAGPGYDGAFRRFAFGAKCRYTGFTGTCPLDRIDREPPEPGARGGAVVLKIELRWPPGWRAFAPRELPSIELAVPASREADVRAHLEKLGGLLCDGNQINEGTCTPEAHRVHAPPLPWTIVEDREDADRWAPRDVEWALCVAGVALACDRLAQDFVGGQSVVENIEQARRLETCARKLAKDACDTGRAEACIDAYALADRYLVAFDGLDAGAIDRLAILLRACELGSAQGCSNAAYVHDDREAAHALRIKACELGRVRDCWELAGRTPPERR